jgi:hypothetical protein
VLTWAASPEAQGYGFAQQFQVINQQKVCNTVFLHIKENYFEQAITNRGVFDHAEPTPK